MNVGSLFSGIGGLELGLERAGMRTVWQVESDAYARAVLWQHWPTVPKYDDVRTVGAANLEPVDLICGGFPCQDLSYAGKGAGIAGARSGLWSEFARLICELRPGYVVVENVPALLARGMGRVLGDLAEIGYDAEWDCIPASAVGAPHRRDRVFLVAYAQRRSVELRRESQDIHRTAGTAQGGRARLLGQDSHPPGDGGAHVADADVAGLEGRDGAVVRERAGQLTARSRGAPMADADGERQQQPRRRVGEVWGRPAHSGWWDTEPDVGRVATRVPARVDRLRCLGNAVVPQVTEHIGRMIMAREAEL